MNLSRIAVVALGAAGLGLAACHGSGVPSDAQLTQLLHSERATPNDPKAPLDAAAVNCLRAWSGDVELSASLPRRADRRPVNSNAVACGASALGGAGRSISAGAVTPRKCSVVTNGIDTVEFAPNFERRSAMRSQLNAGDDFIWLTAGRVVPAKDYPNLLRAFAQAQTAIPQMQLWIAGEAGAAQDKAIESLVRELKLTQRVRMLGLRRNMPGLLDAADAFVLASAWEGMPLAIGEAMAMEKVVVATDVGGVRELVGAAATLVAPRNPEDLAATMLNVARTSHEGLQSIGRAARQRIIESFSIEARVDDWEALYNSLIKAH